ncbi:MAG: hypothetical protein PHP44_07740 [Kiritimatiellae bacterium]|nr:hypothetical protein [Kiritimatiellia bacterium]
MHRLSEVMLVVVLLLTQGYAWGDEPREVQMARKQYNREITPATQRYVNNLNLIKRRCVQKNDHIGAEAVDQEIALVSNHINREGPVVEKKDETKSESVAGKSFFFYPPDKKWLKLLYFQPDGLIIGANNPNETSWEQRGANLLLIDSKGQISATYKYVKRKDGKLYFEHGANGEVYVVIEEARP